MSLGGAFGGPPFPPLPFRFSSREGSLYSAALASDHLSQGQERLSQEILRRDTESAGRGPAGGAESQPSPGDAAALTTATVGSGTTRPGL